jgi:hypothetical protein
MNLRLISKEPPIPIYFGLSSFILLAHMLVDNEHLGCAQRIHFHTLQEIPDVNICVGKGIPTKDQLATLLKGAFGDVPNLPEVEIRKRLEVCWRNYDRNSQGLTLVTNAFAWLPLQTAYPLLFRRDLNGPARRAVKPV